MEMEEYLRAVGVGLRSIDDPFLEDSYQACKIFQRKGVIVEDDEELCHDVIKEFTCYATGCKATFQTLLDFEMHYNTTHRYVCVECRKSLPNPRLLDIHIQETHDTFFEVLSAKQPMYQCYVSECDLKFKDSVERKDHCINVHKFPKNFRFDNANHFKKHEQKNKMDVDCSIDKANEAKAKGVQLNKNQKIKTFTATRKTKILTQSASEEVLPVPLSPNTKASSLMFVPPQLQKSYTKALTKNSSGEKNVLETHNMMEMAESLPD